MSPHPDRVPTAAIPGSDVVPAATFDAGTKGCSDGLAMELRRYLQEVEVGQVIEIILRDPSAKEDMAPLARMMGHRLRSIITRDAESSSILIERGR
jgi:TusA-related sulfurtransferase